MLYARVMKVLDTLVGIRDGLAWHFASTNDELKSSDYLKGDIVKTVGNKNAYDGGSATYYVSDIDSGYSIKLDNGLYANLLCGNYVDVAEFGAIGDGVTDCTEAFNKAVAFAYANKKCVFVPGGTYCVSSIINTNSVSIIGSGKESIIMGIDNTKPIINCTNDITGMTIASLKLSRTSKPSLLENADGIYCANGGMMFWFKDLTIEKQRTGLSIDGNVAGGWLLNCYAENNTANGFYIKMPNMTISNCYASQNGQNGYLFGDSSGCFIEKCEAFLNGSFGYAFAPTDIISDVTMSNCISSFNIGGGVAFTGDAQNVLISDMFCEYSGHSFDGTAVASSHGFVSVGELRNIRISGNFIWNGGSGIAFGSNVYGAVIKASLISNGLFPGSTCGGLQVENGIVKNVYISDCLIGNSTEQAFAQNYGIIFNTLSSENINICNCDVSNNVVANIVGNVSTFNMTNVKGITDGDVFSPSVLASGGQYVNSYGYNVVITILTGDITFLRANGVDLLPTTRTIILKPREALAMAYNGDASSVVWSWMPL